MMARNSARIFTPVNRLARSVDTGAAVAAGDLVRAADRLVADRGQVVHAYVMDQTTTILKAMRMPAAGVFAERRAIAAAALRLAEVAGSIGLGSLGEIAKGIVFLVEGLDEHGWRHDLLSVHASALELASRAPEKPGLRQMTVELAKLRASVGISD